MTTKEMKELHATGEWIAVGCDNVFMRYWEIPNCKFSHTDGLLEYKLIHKKHKEVLDHVLNGGKVCNSFFDEVLTIDVFIENYHEDNTYEIIPIKQDLNGHYCLATHYEQLVKDGYKGTSFDGHKYVKVDDGYFTFSDIIINHKPMHYHNNQWVLGSLEHEEKTKLDDSKIKESFLRMCNVGKFNNHNVKIPPKRITREELDKAVQNGDNKLIQDYAYSLIEYLEANQKD